MLIVKKIALNMIPLILFLIDIFIVDFIIKVNIYEIRLILSIYFWILTPIYFSMINYKHIRNIRTLNSNMKIILCVEDWTNYIGAFYFLMPFLIL